MTEDFEPTANPESAEECADEPADSCRYEFRLYVAGRAPRSVQAFSNLKRICEEYLKGRYTIEVIDLLANPKLAGGDRILAVPALVRRLPEPVRKIIGTLADTERVVIALDLQPEKHD